MSSTHLAVEAPFQPASLAVSPSLSQARRLATFAVLSALAVIAWHAQTSIPFRLNWQTAGFVIALIVLLRPFSRIAFLSLALVETLAVILALPSTNTNRLLQLFVFFSIASTAVYGWLRSGFRGLDPGAWLTLFQPLLRLQLVIVYGLAAWHKLNFGFLNPQSSCAVLLYDRTPFWHLHAGSNLLRWFLILGTIVTEFTLPILLSIRRTRNLAVGHGAAFHFCLGFSGFYAFSVTMISLLFLFTPQHFCDAAVEWWRARLDSVRAAVTIATLLLAAIVLVVTVIKFGPWTQPQFHGLSMGLNAFWLAWAKWAGYWMFLFYLLPLGLFLRLWFERPQTLLPLRRPYAGIPAIFWIVPALLLFDGLNPYLGLKTDTAFAMYSNLRSEGAETNHLIWRHPLALANYQRDLVQVLDSSEPALRPTILKGLPIPFIDLRRHVSRLISQGRHNISLTYIRNGETIHVESAESDPELSAPPSFLERKLLLFRAITTQDCPH